MNDILTKILYGFIGGIIGCLPIFIDMYLSYRAGNKKKERENATEIIVDDEDITVIENSFNEAESDLARTELIRKGLSKAFDKSTFWDGKVGAVVLEIMSDAIDEKWDIARIKKKFAEIDIEL